MNDCPPADKALFLEAIQLPPDAWPEFLREKCGSDEPLRGWVAGLLEAHRVAATRAIDPAETVAFSAASDPEGEGTHIGPYKLIERIGEGGMGVVYLAEQATPIRRKVALKIIKPGMDTRQVVARFEAERQALALMDHPSIAKVHDGGATASGRPYFVMELVRGLPVTDYCDQARLSIPERLVLFTQICRAVQHAHQKGIIHRDLKPSNVLITVIDGAPVPKVIDFGIAKATGGSLTDRSLHTGFHQLVGTPLYMSPEQAELSGVDVDTRSDVYSLGVLLYELLTGTTPFNAESFQKAGLDEVRRIIREDEPARPSRRLSTLAAEQCSTVAERRRLDARKLAGHVRGELDWVVMTCLEKDRNRRYETASALAADVQRYLANEPVAACPPTAGYRVRKFVRRNRGALTATAAGLAVFAILAAGGGWVLGDRASRGARLGAEVGVALGAVEEFRQKGRWPEALEAARRAHALAGSGPAEAVVRERAVRVLADVELVLRLDEVSLERGDLDFDNPSVQSDRRFGEVFRAAGIDAERLTAEEVAERVRETTVAVELAAALETWGKERWNSHGQDDPVWRRLFEAARLADPDEWRCRLRKAMAVRDVQALQELAGSRDVAGLPPSSVVLLAGVLEETGMYDRATAVLLDARRRHPDDIWINHYLGRNMQNSKPPRTEEAIRFHTVVVALRPQSSGTNNSLGAVLTTQGRWDEAIINFKEAIRLQPNAVRAYRNLGLAQYRKGQVDAAIASFRDAIRLQPDNAKAHKSLGLALNDTGQFDAAIASYKEVIRIEPDNAMAYSDLGAILCDQKRDFDGAIDAFRNALRIQPDHVLAHFNLGNALKAKGQWDDAIASYEKAIRHQPDYAPAHDCLGQTFLERGRLDKAIECFRESLRLKPGNPGYHINLGIALKRKGQIDDAIASYKEAIRIQPDYAFAHANLGSVLSNDKRDYDGAIAAYREAIRLLPNHARLHTDLGITLKRKGLHREAIAAFEEGNRLQPNFAPSINELAWLLATCPDPQLSDPAKAVRLAKSVVQRDAEYANAWNTLGVAQYRNGEWKAAVEALTESMRLKSGGTGVDWFFLAMAHGKLGDKDRARTWYDKAVAWMDGNKSQDEQLRRFRAEAEELLGIPAPSRGPKR